MYEMFPIPTWSTVGTPTLPPKPQRQEVGYLGRFVAWIKKDRPIILQIAVRCLALIAAVFACLSIIAIPLLYQCVKESLRLDKENKIIRNSEEMEKQRDEVVQSIGMEKFNALPILDLGNLQGHTGYIDFLEEQDLSHALMKGVDIHKRPFITFKVLDKQTNTRFVQTIFQRYSDESLWVWGSHSCRFDGIFNGTIIDKKNLERFSKVVQGQDLRFVLVN